MSIFDAGMYATRQPVDPGQQTERAVAFVFVVVREPRVGSRLWQPFLD